MLQVTQVFQSFGPHAVLNGVNLKLTPSSRVGLVGVNGGGKSTLLGLMMGELTPDEGHITITPGTQVNWLTQNPRLTLGNTLHQELLSVFTDDNTDPGETTRIEAERDANISRMVQGLGFSLDELGHKVEHFSGGWQMRINLAKVLLQGADILLMDEPTNHLDLAACEWLENFLLGYPGGYLVVSHDRRFLDSVVSDIAELERGELTVWSGNYSQYLSQKAALHDRLNSAADRQQKALAEQMAFVDRFRASATKSKQAKSREKQLAKIERIEAPQVDHRQMKMTFPVAQVSGREVLNLNEISKAYGSKILYQQISGTIERQQRIFLLGDNGCGKSTMFRLVMGLESPDKGEIRFGTKVQLGYYAQHHLETLDPTLNVYDTLEGLMPTTPQSKIRAILGRFLFTADEVFKPVSVLSGGEKSRLALAKLLVTGPNTLLLDEPTNHLDIPAQEAVEAALQDYEGTILCISHDRQFIQRLATHIWEFHNGQLITFEGTYDEYMPKRKSLIKALNPQAFPTNADKAAHAVVTQPSPLQERKQVEKQIKKIEKQIVAEEKQRSALQAQLLDPAFATDYITLDRLGKELAELDIHIANLEQRWQDLSNALI